MTMNYKNALALVLSSGLLVGCASTKEIDALKTMVEEAKQEAAMAKQEAAQARATAEEAMRMSQATDERTNRMFRRSMFK